MNEDKSTELFLAKAELKMWMWVLASVQLLFLAFIIAGQMLVQKEAADKWAEERGFRGGDRQKSASDTAFLGGTAKIYGGKDC